MLQDSAIVTLSKIVTFGGPSEILQGLDWSGLILEDVRPLNSKRIAIHRLQVLARTLSLLTNVSKEDLFQLVSGELTAKERNPRNIQVVVRRECLVLQDEGGVFLEAEINEGEELGEGELGSSQVSIENDNESPSKSASPDITVDC